MAIEIDRFIIFIILNVLFNQIQIEAALFTQTAILHPEHIGKCYDPVSRRALIPGKEYQLKGACAALMCDINTQVISIETCPHIDMPDCIEVPVDLKRTFPKCCPQFKCIDFKTGEEFMTSL